MTLNSFYDIYKQLGGDSKYIITIETKNDSYKTSYEELHLSDNFIIFNNKGNITFIPFHEIVKLSLPYKAPDTSLNIFP
jgi:hypothetical protein